MRPLVVLALLLAFAPALGPVASALPDEPSRILAAWYSFAPAVALVWNADGAVEHEAVLLSHTLTTLDGPLGEPNDPDNSDGDPSTFNVPLVQGQRIASVFPEGVHHYRCDIHDRYGMYGAIVVLDQAAPP